MEPGVHILEEKLLQVESALKLCESEKVLLSSNLSTIKQSVEQSFKRHIGTLQCRAKWLACHADSIYHLKEGSLNQQITELRQISTELHTTLQQQQKQHQHQHIGKLLDSVDSVSLQPCEGGSMVFVADDNILEEMIIGYGDIDTEDRSILDDCCDLLSDDDEGVFVVERSTRQQQQQQQQPDPIEMKVKSIEMHHLTAQSANNEKEDFERIEMEVYDYNGVDLDEEEEAHLKPVKESSQHGDSGVEEETESSDYGEWLHPRGNTPVEKEEKVSTTAANEAADSQSVVDFHKEDSLDLDVDSMSQISESKKVPLWLKKCADPPNPWIRGCASPALLKSTCDIDDKPFSAVAEMPMQTESSGDIKEVTTNVALVDNILSDCNSSFLRCEAEKPLSSLSSDFSLIDFSEKTDSTVSSESKVTNTEKFDSIFNSDSSEFLRNSTKNNNSITNNNDNFDNSISSNNNTATTNADLSTFLIKQSSVEQSMTSLSLSSAMEANISHICGILEGEANQFLAPSTQNQVDNLPPVRASNVINYLRSLESKPNSAFLRTSGKRTKFDAEMCEWLRSGGPSVDSCMQCSDFQSCEMSGGGVGLGSKWVKTANDW